MNHLGVRRMMLRNLHKIHLPLKFERIQIKAPPKHFMRLPRTLPTTVHNTLGDRAPQAPNQILVGVLRFANPNLNQRMFPLLPTGLGRRANPNPCPPNLRTVGIENVSQSQDKKVHHGPLTRLPPVTSYVVPSANTNSLHNLSYESGEGDKNYKMI